MPAKRKKSHDPKQAADPLGKRMFFLTILRCLLKYIFCVLDDILRKNLFLSKYARSADQQTKQLGK